MFAISSAFRIYISHNVMDEYLRFQQQIQIIQKAVYRKFRIGTHVQLFKECNTSRGGKMLCNVSDQIWRILAKKMYFFTSSRALSVCHYMRKMCRILYGTTTLSLSVNTLWSIYYHRKLVIEHFQRIPNVCTKGEKIGKCDDVAFQYDIWKVWRRTTTSGMKIHKTFLLLRGLFSSSNSSIDDFFEFSQFSQFREN